MSHYLNIFRLFVAKLFTKYTTYKSKECDVPLFYSGNLAWKR